LVPGHYRAAQEFGLDTAPTSRFEILRKDLTAGLVVFLVALPLCLGIAEASDAPAFAGLIAGIVGGLVVAAISGSRTSVSGPAAGLTAVVAAELHELGSFEALLVALAMAGVIQILLGIVRAGRIAAFVPTAVIRGLLAAIGVILILKQLPHLFGHDTDPEGEMSFVQPDQENTFSEILSTLNDAHAGAAVVGMSAFLLLIFWDKIKLLKSSPVPAPLVVVVIGTVASTLLASSPENWAIDGNHLVQVPVAGDIGEFFAQFRTPDFDALALPGVYSAAVVLAAVASLETLLNLEAVDKIDPERRVSPPNRELVAQGFGNLVSGLIGGLPVTSVIVRSSVNLQMGVKTRLSAISHGVLLLGTAGFLPEMLNRIPLSCLAAILLHTGFKLADPKLFASMWRSGWSQFLPFVITIVAIVRTDLLIGVLIGLGVSALFILWQNVRLPVQRLVEKRPAGDVLRIQLPSQVTFLNRAAIARALSEVPRGGHVLIDATQTGYVDPDVALMIREYVDETAKARGVRASLAGFAAASGIVDHLEFDEHASREVQRDLTPDQVLGLLKEGNRRFLEGRPLFRDLGRQKAATAAGQFPLAVVVSCIDSRAPTELIFDLGLGDVFVARIAGNVVRHKMLGSIEYACSVAGAKLCVVLGHTGCGAVTSAIQFARDGRTAKQATGLDHLEMIVEGIQESVSSSDLELSMDAEQRSAFVDEVARRNVLRQIERIHSESPALVELERQGRIKIVGAMYDLESGAVEWLEVPIPSS
jgi:MFS superfamily sulfate permease-like transporter